MKPLFKKIIFVSNSFLNDNNKDKIETFCDKILIRENTGYDFAAWKHAIYEEGWEILGKFDSLTLMNDTCFGPLFDMRIIYNKMESGTTDFWGLTNHPKMKLVLSEKEAMIDEHIQSYFMSFKSSIVISSIFKNFWESIIDKNEVSFVIINYESQLTGILSKAGFKYNVLLDSVKENSSSYKLSTFTNTYKLVQIGIPFVKVKSFLFSKNPIFLKKVISQYSNYNIELIDNYFNENFTPNVSVGISNKTFICGLNKTTNYKFSLKVAIHFHVFYIDIFEIYISFLIDNSINFDLFITTDTEVKKNQIIELFEIKSKSHLLKEILVFENRGRDVLPWLQIADKLNTYDLVAHFHTKKTITADEWIGASWMKEIVDSLLHPMSDIIQLFEDEKKLGIVIPDIPVFYKKIYGVDMWNKTKILFNELWIRMNCNKKINLKEISTPIMPYGTMFWYRPAALNPLFNLKLSQVDFPLEPLSNDGSIAHAIESILVYVAWDQGYNFKVVINNDYVLTGFDNTMYAELIAEKNQLFRSITWRTGRLFTWIPGKIIKLLKK
ncbi:MAG: rhamnan synthesis F family protein [Bacteroidota bacterium]